MQQLTVADLATRLAAGESLCIVDVREPWEVDIGRLPDSLHIPMGQITRRLDELPTDKPLVCLCHHGMRSQQVAMFLAHQGFSPVFNLTGGIDAWAREIDSQCPTY